MRHCQSPRCRIADETTEASMTTYFFQFATTAALVIAQIAPTLAQPVPPTAPSQGGPQVLPARLDVPQIFPTP